MLVERLARYERIVVPVCLVAVMALAWAYLLAGAGTMQDMGGMVMPMSTWPWSLAHAAVMLIMWLVMMVAMMLPSAMPVILLYTTLNRRSEGSRIAVASFTTGYIAIWGGFSILALLGQFFLEQAALLSSMMEATSDVVSGILLLFAGIYQFTPLKRACLRLCRSPIEFLSMHWRPGNFGAFVMGARHGVYCVGCCWGLMLLLFVGGLMNVIWIAGLAAFVLIEKLAPSGPLFGQAAGVAFIILGAVVLAQAL